MFHPTAISGLFVFMEEKQVSGAPTTESIVVGEMLILW